MVVAEVGQSKMVGHRGQRLQKGAEGRPSRCMQLWGHDVGSQGQGSGHLILIPPALHPTTFCPSTACLCSAMVGDVFRITFQKLGSIHR